jgi:hypothetical protein
MPLEAPVTRASGRDCSKRGAGKVRRGVRVCGLSMRHQRGNRHRLQDAAGDAAKDELAQARVAVAAQHKEVFRRVGRMGRQNVRRLGVGRNDLLDLDREPMAGQMRGAEEKRFRTARARSGGISMSAGASLGRGMPHAGN